MHILSIMEQGHRILLDSIKGIGEEESAQAGACELWSIKEVMAHIASSEAVLVDILVRLDDATPTSDFDRWVADPDGFDVAAIARRQDLPLSRIVDEYQAYYETAIDLLLHLPDDKLRQQVPVPWGAGLRDAEDLIVGAFYGHKREHAAQIRAYRSGRMAMHIRRTIEFHV
ncbi:MAG: DinB family protein [Chloroflexi bacterium]|nr:DinB family protein [Chloroflexota bacterium]